MKRRTRQSRYLVLGVVAAVGALSAVPAQAGTCMAEGQERFQVCIEAMANFFGGEVPPTAEASCSEVAAEYVMSCLPTKPSFEYTVCTQSYSVWLESDETGGNLSVAVAFYGSFVCN